MLPAEMTVEKRENGDYSSTHYRSVLRAAGATPSELSTSN